MNKRVCSLLCLCFFSFFSRKSFVFFVAVVVIQEREINIIECKKREIANISYSWTNSGTRNGERERETENGEEGFFLSLLFQKATTATAYGRAATDNNNNATVATSTTALGPFLPLHQQRHELCVVRHEPSPADADQQLLYPAGMSDDEDATAAASVFQEPFVAVIVVVVSFPPARELRGHLQEHLRPPPHRLCALSRLQVPELVVF